MIGDLLVLPPRVVSADAVRVRALRRAFGETQAAFAYRLGVTVSTMNRWEQGHATPSPLARRMLQHLEDAKAT